MACEESTDTLLGVLAAGQPGQTAGATPLPISIGLREDMKSSNTRVDGIAGGLLQAADRLAIRSGCRGLQSSDMFVEGGEEDRRWRGWGFVESERTQQGEALFTDFRNATKPLADRLEARGRRPAGSRIVSLKEAPPAAVANLLADAMDVPRDRLYALIVRTGPDSMLSRFSAVALGDSVVLGALLVTEEPDGWPCIGAIGVDESARSGWVNVAVRAAVAERVIAAGIEWGRWHVWDRYRDTVNFMKRLPSLRRCDLVRLVRIPQPA